MAIKRKGIVAIPGEYKYGDLTEVKTAEELDAAAERTPIIPITRGHPVDGFPKASDIIGTCSLKKLGDGRTGGEFWFHEEKITDEERDQLMLQPVPISAGFLIDELGENGEQKGIVYTHIAKLTEEDPRCPLGECGVNIRMDSKDEEGRLYRMDQKSEIEAPEPPEESQAEEPEPEPEPEPVTEPSEPVAEEPAEQKPEESQEPEPEVQREPEVIIPKPTGSKKELQREGKYTIYTPKIYRESE